MARTARASVADYCYHVLNRGNGRAEVFHTQDDYEAFLGMIAEASARLPMRVLGYCLMPNHFHLVLRPHGDGELSSWMQWLLTTHVRRYHRHYGSSGHVWQGRFKAFPCQNDGHLLTVLRYVERNALRAGLVPRAEDWPYGSLHASLNPPGPVRLEAVSGTTNPRTWARRVNRPLSDAELAAMRHSVARGTPYGSEDWTRDTASILGLESSLRPRGRPRKVDK
ncbi:transposase [Tautonia rosea]|uniref:transposase n=1 Tax=Tautonia rosea TaxID=2728037 RepID=UPI001475382D|nr:transposase [Tautonia rosea]